MKKIVAIGIQDFEKIRERDCFYIDKTELIREWWEQDDDVTLITRPRRFGKTLNMSMLECFFSNKYEGRGELFEGLKIWQEEKYRKLQGTYPVLSLSFAGVILVALNNCRRQLFSATAYTAVRFFGRQLISLASINLQIMRLRSLH